MSMNMDPGPFMSYGAIVENRFPFLDFNKSSIFFIFLVYVEHFDGAVNMTHWLESNLNNSPVSKPCAYIVYIGNFMFSRSCL